MLARDVLAASMSEADLSRAVIDAARFYGWRVFHPRPVEDRHGRWRTAVEGDPGFPDLVLARDGVVILVETKAARGRFEPGQREWLEAAAGIVLRPADLDGFIRDRLAPPLTLGRSGVDKSTDGVLDSWERPGRPPDDKENPR